MSVATSAPAAKKKSRGRETALDMFRSIGLMLIIIVPIWLLFRPTGSDSQTVRVVDPAADIASYAQQAPGVPVPGTLPTGWRATSSTLDPGSLRIGWVTPSGQYAEYASSTQAASAFLPGITGSAARVGTFRVGTVTWQQYSDGDRHTSLVRNLPGGTVVVGGVRETTTLSELGELAGALR